MDRQLFAQFDRRSLIAQSGNEEFHAAAACGGLNPKDLPLAKRTRPNLAI
jgi:hypothetical protein